AEQVPMPVIGYLSARAPAPNGYFATAFRRGLAETGYIEGRNIVIEYRWADNQYDRLPALAADLVRRQVSVIAAISGTAAAVAAKAATMTIPIVFAHGGDPIRSGLVTSYRPTGNITGVTFFSSALSAKRLQLMHELAPNVAAMGFLTNPNNRTGVLQTRDVRAATREIGLELHVLTATSTRGLDAAFTTLLQHSAGALVIAADPFFLDSTAQLVALAARHAVPTM